ncbi:hypothetical protein Tco_1336940 [Tanacetum coccineum]
MRKMMMKKIEWVDTHEEEEKNDEDNDKIIDLEKTDDEETNDEFVHSDEHVQNDDEETNDEFVHGDEQVNDDEDEEITNAEDADTRNGDEAITDAAKADAEKTKEAKDDIKEAEFPPLSSRLSISLGFGNQFLNLSSAKSTVGNLKDSIDAEINSLLDVKIQQEIPHIQSSSILSVPVFVISEPSVLTPIPETPSVAPATTLLPPLSVSTIPPILLQSTTSIPTPPITTKAPPVTMIPDPLHAIFQRVYVLEKDKYPQQIDYNEMIKESMQANIINEVKNQLPKFLPNAISDFATLTILFYLTHDKHQALFDALLNSLSLDDAIASGQADLEKVLRKRDRDEEDPSAGPNQGKKTKRSRTKESEPSKKSSTSKDSSKGKSPVKTSKSGKYVTAEEPVEEPVFEMASDDIEQTIVDAVNDVDQPHNDST